jgi:hypothetical protein
VLADVSFGASGFPFLILANNILTQKRENSRRPEKTSIYEKLRNMYFSPNIVRMIKSKQMIWVGRVAREVEF